MVPLFNSMERYWSLDNVTQTENLTSNATSRTQLMTSITDVTQQVINSSGRELHFGIINDSCITNYESATCPDGITVSFWLRLWKTRPSVSLKILGFGQPNEDKRGFLVIEHEDKVRIKTIGLHRNCEIEFDIIDGVWTHVVFSFRHHFLKGYLNGKFETSIGTCAHGPNLAVDTLLSSGTAVAAFDELMIWYRVLVKDTILSIFEYSIGKSNC